MNIEEEVKLRSRLNKIYYWQIADTLKLTTSEEKRMIEILESTQEKRERSLEQRQQTLKAIEHAAGDISTLSKQEAQKFVQEYMQALENNSRVDLDQIQALLKVIGPQKLVVFLKSRREMSDKILESIR